MEANDVVVMLRSKAWIPLVALGVAAVIRISKTDAAVARIPFYIKPQHRAWWALGFGIIGGIADRVVAGVPLLDAVIVGVIGGLLAGQTAIAGHELIVEGLRKGRDIGIKKEPPPPPPTDVDLSAMDSDSLRPPPADPPGTIRYLPLAARSFK